MREKFGGQHGKKGYKPMRKGKRFGGYEGDFQGFLRYFRRKERRQNKEESRIFEVDLSSVTEIKEEDVISGMITVLYDRTNNSYTFRKHGLLNFEELDRLVVYHSCMVVEVKDKIVVDIYKPPGAKQFLNQTFNSMFNDIKEYHNQIIP